MFDKVIIPPSLTVKLYGKSCVVSYRSGGLHDPYHLPEIALPTRGPIKSCSPKSRNKARLVLEDTGHVYKVKSCLTYPVDFPCTGIEVKRHWDLLMKRIHRKYGEVFYFWCLEFQERGAPHLHLLLSRFIDKNWLSRAWYEIVGSGDPRHLAAGTFISSIKDPDHDIGYLTTYLGKEYQKNVPEDFGAVGRFWGSNLSTSPHKIIKVTGTQSDVESLYKEMEDIYTEQLKEWSSKSGKEYTFKERDYPGFIAWASTGKILSILEGKTLIQEKPDEEIKNEDSTRTIHVSHVTYVHAFSRHRQKGCIDGYGKGHINHGVLPVRGFPDRCM